MVLIARHDEKLRVAIGRRGDLEVPFGWVEEDTVGTGAQPVQCFEDHDRIAEMGAIGGILRVGKAMPIHSVVVWAVSSFPHAVNAGLRSAAAAMVEPKEEDDEDEEGGERSRAGAW